MASASVSTSGGGDAASWGAVLPRRPDGEPGDVAVVLRRPLPALLEAGVGAGCALVRRGAVLLPAAAAELTDDDERFAFAVAGAVLSLFHAFRRSDNDGALLIVTVCRTWRRRCLWVSFQHQFLNFLLHPDCTACFGHSEPH